MAPVDGALVRAFHILRTFCINHFSSLHWTTTFISRDKGIQYQPVRSHFHHMITFFSIWHCYASRLSFVFKLKRFETAYCGRSFLIKSCTRSTDSHSGSVHRVYGGHICNLYADHDFTTATYSDKKKKKKSPVSIFIVSDHARPKHAADAGEEAHTQFWPRFFDNDVAICVKQVIRVMSKNSFGIGLHPS